MVLREALGGRGGVRSSALNMQNVCWQDIVVYLKLPSGKRKNQNVLRAYRATWPRIRALSLVRGECTTAPQGHESKIPGS